MDHNNGNPIIAFLMTVLSVSSGFFALITLKEVQLLMTLIATLTGIISGGFAIRHYYYSTKKIKKELPPGK